MSELLGATSSLCPVCLEVVPAEVLSEAGRVLLRKTCPRHGTHVSPHLWQREEIYRRLAERIPGQGRPAAGLVINLTNRCNQSCPYCYSRANEAPLPELSLDDVERIAAAHPGQIVYLSGGEPTVRADLVEAVERLKQTGRTVGLFSNGALLGDAERVRRLKAAGLDFVILQFDTLQAERYAVLREADLLGEKLRAVQVLGEHQLPVYLFVMLAPGVNTDEVGALLRFAADHHETVKIVNFNPVWRMGRSRPAELTPGEILELVCRELPASAEDFLQTTELGLLLSELQARLGRRPVNVHPCCELRCYAMVVDGRLVPISRVLDLPRLNALLRRVLAGKSRLALAQRLVTHLPLFAATGLRLLATRLSSWTLLGRLLDARLGFHEQSSPLARAPLLSVIVGTFHDVDSIDLGFQRTCNLYSHLLADDLLLPACARQILVDRLSGEGRRGGAEGGGEGWSAAAATEAARRLRRHLLAEGEEP
jgi:uncharacterized radical SAM superfamily Fe-S cluster-containing enzyme